MKIKDLMGILNEICPQELQEEWDNSGIQIEASHKDIKKVLVALEVTEDVIKEAIGLNVDLIITHHPLFFGEFNSIMQEPD